MVSIVVWPDGNTPRGGSGGGGGALRYRTASHCQMAALNGRGECLHI